MALVFVVPSARSPWEVAVVLNAGASQVCMWLVHNKVNVGNNCLLVVTASLHQVHPTLPGGPKACHVASAPCAVASARPSVPGLGGKGGQGGPSNNPMCLSSASCTDSMQQSGNNSRWVQTTKQQGESGKAIPWLFAHLSKL